MIVINECTLCHYNPTYLQSMRSSRQEFHLQRHAQQEQLCRLVLALPQRKLPQDRIESEFDDRAISRAPQSQLNQKLNNPSGSAVRPAEEDQQRRERIKIKIKSQVREKIKKLSRQWSVGQPPHLSLSGRAHPQSRQSKSNNLFTERLFQSQRLNNILGKCVAEQIHLRHKEVFRQTKYRSRLLSTGQKSSHGSSSLHGLSLYARGKLSTPNLEMNEGAVDGVAPWRYHDDPQLEEVAFRRL